MTRYLRVLPVLIGLAATGGPPAAADPPEPGVIKERAGYLPVRRYVPLPGKVVGILLADGKDRRPGGTTDAGCAFHATLM